MTPPSPFSQPWDLTVQGRPHGYFVYLASGWFASYWNAFLFISVAASYVVVSIFMNLLIITARKRSLGQGYIFTGICHSVNRGVCLSACWDTPLQGNPTPGRLPLQGDPLPSRETPAPPGRPPSRETPLQAHTQGGILRGSDPGPHPRGKLRGIRSRPSPKGEIEGDQTQTPLPAMTTTAVGILVLNSLFGYLQEKTHPYIYGYKLERVVRTSFNSSSFRRKTDIELY